MSGIRLLSADEAQAQRLALAEILQDCVAGGASVNFLWPYSLDEAGAWWDNALEGVVAGRTILFGAYADQRLSGTVQLGLDTPPNQRHRGEVKKLLIHRRARRQGLAEGLMTALEEEARRRSLTLLTLDTVTNSPADRLYRKLGWTEVGAIPNYALLPGGEPAAASIFWKAL